MADLTNMTPLLSINPPRRLVAWFAAFAWRALSIVGTFFAVAWTVTLAVRWVLGALGAAVLVVMLTTPGRAETTLELYRECTGSSVGRPECLGFLRGYWDGLQELGNALGSPAFCDPAAVSAGVMREIFDEWVYRHRFNLPDDEHIAALRAFRAAYPCQSSAEIPVEPSPEASAETPPKPASSPLTLMHIVPSRTAGGLVIEGDVVNTGGQARSVPLLHISLHNAGAQEVQAKTILPPLIRLTPWATEHFKTTFTHLNEAATRVVVTFADSFPHPSGRI